MEEHETYLRVKLASKIGKKIIKITSKLGII